jgi:hypothetical protein
MNLPSHDLLFSLVLITTVACAVYGLTGFGATFIGISRRRHADLHELRHLLPFVMIRHGLMR